MKQFVLNSFDFYYYLRCPFVGSVASRSSHLKKDIHDWVNSNIETANVVPDVGLITKARLAGLGLRCTTDETTK